MSYFPPFNAEKQLMPIFQRETSLLESSYKITSQPLFPSQVMPITNTKGKERDSLMFPILTADCHKFPSP